MYVEVDETKQGRSSFKVNNNMANHHSQRQENQPLDREVQDLLKFLNDFECYPTRAASKKEEFNVHDNTRKPSTTLSGPVRRPLSRLPLNRVDYGNIRDVDNDSITTSPSVVVPKLALHNNKAQQHNNSSWAKRMTEAVSDWKEKHEQLTIQRLKEQQDQLQARHEEELKRLRQELHEYYTKKFLEWQDEYVASLQETFKYPSNEPAAKPQIDLTANTAKSVASLGVDKKSSSINSRRQYWTSPDGKRITNYGNGTLSEKNPDGSTVTFFANGDIQTTGSSPDSPTKSCYYYGSTRTLRMDQADGSVIWSFHGGQREHHFPDGRKEVIEWASEAVAI